MKKSISYLLLPAFLTSSLLLTGCAWPKKSGTGVVVVPQSEQEKINIRSSAIRLGTSAAVAIGLTAVPDKTQADAIAVETAKILDNDVIPLLNGDEQVLSSGIKQILELDKFNDPKLAKLKSILTASSSLLMSYLPPDILDQQIEKMPPDVVAYIRAFFYGVKDGVVAYQGITSKALLKHKKNGVNYSDLRNELSRKD